SGPPGGEQIVRVALGVVHLIDRELEEPALFARREMLELPELLIECLEAAHLLAVVLGPALDLTLDALIRIVAELQVLEVGERERDHPRRESLQRLDRQSEPSRLRRRALIELLANGIAQRRTLGKQAVLKHPGLHRVGIDAAQVELHDD